MESGSLREPLPMIKSDLGAEVAYLMSHFRRVKSSLSEEVAYVIDHFSMGRFENLRNRTEPLFLYDTKELGICHWWCRPL